MGHKKEKSKLKKLSPEEKIVFEAITEETSFEEIINKTNEKVDKVKLFSIIMSLEIKGLITETNGSKYIRII